MITPIEALNIVTYVIAIASIIVKATPSQKDDKILGKIVKALEFVSMNKDKLEVKK